MSLFVLCISAHQNFILIQVIIFESLQFPIYSNMLHNVRYDFIALFSGFDVMQVYINIM